MDRTKLLRKLIDDRFNGKQAEFARAIDRSPSQVYQLHSGRRSVGDAMARHIEMTLNLGEGWFDGIKKTDHKPESDLGEVGKFKLWSSKDPLPDDEFASIPFYKDITFKGGSGSYMLEDNNGFVLPFGRSTLYRYGINANKAGCFTLRGNSMEPVLREGCAFGVNFEKTDIRDGEIYAFGQGDLFRVKILYRLPNGKIRIRSYNSDEYEDEIADLNDIEIVGHVFWWSVMA